MTDKSIGRMQLSFFSFESGQVPRRLLSKGLPDAELQKKMETGRCRNQEDDQTRFNRSSQVAKYDFYYLPWQPFQLWEEARLAAAGLPRGNGEVMGLIPFSTSTVSREPGALTA